jgi:hypothetical protein
MKLLRFLLQWLPRRSYIPHFHKWHDMGYSYEMEGYWQRCQCGKWRIDKYPLSAAEKILIKP